MLFAVGTVIRTTRINARSGATRLGIKTKRINSPEPNPTQRHAPPATKARTDAYPPAMLAMRTMAAVRRMGLKRAYAGRRDRRNSSSRIWPAANGSMTAGCHAIRADR